MSFDFRLVPDLLELFAEARRIPACPKRAATKLYVDTVPIEVPRERFELARPRAWRRP